MENTSFNTIEMVILNIFKTIFNFWRLPYHKNWKSEVLTDAWTIGVGLLIAAPFGIALAFIL